MLRVWRSSSSYCSSSDWSRPPAGVRVAGLARMSPEAHQHQLVLGALVVKRQHRHLDCALFGVILVVNRTGGRLAATFARLEQRGARCQPPRVRHRRHEVARRLTAGVAWKAAGLRRDMHDVGILRRPGCWAAPVAPPCAGGYRRRKNRRPRRSVGRRFVTLDRPGHSARCLWHRCRIGYMDRTRVGLRPINPHAGIDVDEQIGSLIDGRPRLPRMSCVDMARQGLSRTPPHLRL